jgi:hypothetical protein
VRYIEQHVCESPQNIIALTFYGLLRLKSIWDVSNSIITLFGCLVNVSYKVHA